MRQEVLQVSLTSQSNTCGSLQDIKGDPAPKHEGGEFLAWQFKLSYGKHITMNTLTQLYTKTHKHDHTHMCTSNTETH